MKKKVLLVLPNLAGGGAEKVMVTLLKNFDRKRADYHFLVVDKQGPYIDDLPSDIPITSLGVKGKFFFKKNMLTVQKKLISAINKIKPDVILTTLTEMNIIILSIRRFLENKPKIVIRETNPPTPRWNGIRKNVMKLLYSKFYAKADNIIAISEGVKKDLLHFANIPENKVKVIYNPVPIKDIQSKANENLEINKVGSDTYNIVSVGRLTKQKDYPTLLRAIRIVSENYNVRLNILGTGEQYNDLKELSKELNIEDKVNFLGFLNNPHALVKKSDLFVLSSKWEGFGLVIVEALATGTPVITTDANGAPREILENGKYGVLTKVGDFNGMADAIIKVINDEIVFDEEELISRSYDFDVNVVSENYLRLLLLM